VEQHAGFLSIKDVVSEFVGDPHKREAIENLVSGLVPKAVEQVLNMVGQSRDSDKRAKALMTDERFETLKTNLPLLVRQSPALARTQKAGALQTVTGNELMGVMFVCDARPVYNKSRDDIDGYVPLATMKIIYQRQNADTEEIEFVMTPEEIDLLIQRAEQARDKIKVLNAKMSALLPNAVVEDQS